MKSEKQQRKIKNLFYFFTIVLLFSFYDLHFVGAQTPEELQQQIEARLQELNSINAEIEKNERELEATQRQKTSLQQEVKSINYKVQQVDLGIRSSEVNLEKLSLELASLGYEIEDMRRTIEIKKEAVVRLLRQLQQKDNESLLIAMLRGQSLAENVLEAQAIISLHVELANEVESLRVLQEGLTNQFSAQSRKKSLVSLENQNLKSQKTILADQKTERSTFLAQTQSQEKLYQEQLAKLREQQNSISDAISEIEDELRRTFDPSILPVKRPGVFAWPVALKSDGGSGRITQHYGEVSYLYRGKPHNGLDIGAPVGTPVFAAEKGVVQAVDNNDVNAWSKYQYGKYVLIRHTNNLTTLYAHLSNNGIVRAGDTVERGQLVGYVGSTGYSTGPHLHFGMYWAPSVIMKSIPPARGLVPVGVIIDPEDYL